MKKNIINLLRFSLVAFLLVGFSGCTSKNKVNQSATGSNNANVIFLWSVEDEPFWADAATAFVQANKNYTFKYKQIAFDDRYEEKLLNALTSGEGPDVWAMPDDWVYRHKEKLFALPATQMKNFSFDNLVPSVKTKNVIGGNLYAVANYGQPLYLYYNKTVVINKLSPIVDNPAENAEKREKVRSLLSDRLPVTWDDATYLSNLITEKNGSQISLGGLALGTSKINYSQDILYLLMLQKGAQMTSEDLKVATFSLPKENASGRGMPGKDALDFYTSFANPSSSNYSWNDSLGDNIDAFCNNKSAMIVGYPQTEKILTEKCPNIGVKKSLMPQFTETENSVDYAKNISYGISWLSPKKEISWEFLKQLSGGRGVRTSNISPKVKDRVPDTGDLDLAAMNTSAGFLKGRFPAEFDGYIEKAIDDVNSGLLDSQSALSSAANEINEKLLKNAEWR